MPYDQLDDLWDDAHAARLSPLERLVYRSNLLGSDPRITNTGGGNTSSKLTMPDPLSGEAVAVLWVKGSGGDLRTARAEHFASLYLDKLKQLKALYAQAPERGAKSPAEDAMVARYAHATYNLNPRASSIDTPLHAFIPYRHVDHTHPTAIIAIAACRDAERLTREIFGERVGYLPWQRPGFDLGLKLEALLRDHPQLEGVILGQHGLINWADDDKACYQRTLALINRAAAYLAERDRGEAAFGGPKYPTLDAAARQALLYRVLPQLRGMLSQQARVIATVDARPEVLAFVSSRDAARLAELGTSCPDHFLRTKIKPLYIDWDPQTGADALLKALEAGLARYREDYTRYYQHHRRPDSPPMRDPNPTVILIPGAGLVAWGKDKSESRITAEFYAGAIEVMRGAEAVSSYCALPPQEAFDIEYWALEEAKLRRMPPEKEFSRRVALVVGAGSGIGRAVAERLAGEGAQVVCADINLEAAQQCARELSARHGVGIGAAGSGISGCGPAIALAVDITQRPSIRHMLEQLVLAYGGLDHLIITAGIFVAPDAAGNIPDDAWALTYAINVTGSYLVVDEARHILAAQQLSGSVVLTTSANAVVAKQGSLAYDTSKAAANHLVRELAIALAPQVRVNGLAPATVVEGSAMFPRERLISSLRKYRLPVDEEAPTETLRAQLAQFYAERSLLKAPVTLADQAEAAYLLLSERLGKTTGQILSVDGGLVEAFLR